MFMVTKLVRALPGGVGDDLEDALAALLPEDGVPFDGEHGSIDTAMQMFFGLLENGSTGALPLAGAGGGEALKKERKNKSKKR
jgi:hypothetical protein